MAFKNSKLYSMVTMTCPRCHKGDLFKTKSAYMKGMADTNLKCSNCSEDFKREPGFYFGAAYVSYALTVALWVAVFVALVTFDAIGLIDFSFFEDAILFLVVGVLALLIFMPIMYRLSRSMWIHMFVKYRPDAIEYNEKKAQERLARKEEATLRQSSH